MAKRTPQQQKHYEQYEHNIAIVEHLRHIAPAAWDWIITVRFYCAMHVVEMYITDAMRANVPPSERGGHRERNYIILNTPFFKAIKAAYLDLYQKSQGARYDMLYDEQIAAVAGRHLQNIVTQILH